MMINQIILKFYYNELKKLKSINAEILKIRTNLKFES